MALAALLTGGCGAGGPTTIPVRGEVVFNGAPLKDGIVVYIPAGGAARQATGRIQPDGTFVLTTFKDADGVVPGEYQIIIYSYAAGPGETLSRNSTKRKHALANSSGRLQFPKSMPTRKRPV